MLCIYVSIKFQMFLHEISFEFIRLFLRIFINRNNTHRDMYHLARLKRIPYCMTEDGRRSILCTEDCLSEVFKVPPLFSLMSTSRNVAFSVEY